MYRSTAGPGHDLEVFSYERKAFVTLPNPAMATPFGQQGEQLLDFQNRHTASPQVAQMSGFHTTNPLPSERFVGPFRRHIHEPLPLSVNEIVFD
jgi:hypothetical protein